MAAYCNFNIGCGHCKAMKPAYGEAASLMKSKQVKLLTSFCCICDSSLTGI